MSKTATNLIVILGIVTVVFGAYFFFSQSSDGELQSTRSAQQLDQLFASSQLFVQRSQALSEISLDPAILESDTFNSLKDFSSDPDEYQVGRSNPFAPTAAARPINTPDQN